MKKCCHKEAAILSATEAGKYIHRQIGKIKEVRYKGEKNVVTNVDKKAESIIISSLRKCFPSYGFLAEESIPKRKNPNRIRPEFNWIIDPLDGTTNFLHGFPVFCVSIALEHNDEIILGVVYDPSRNELFVAEKNKGAFLNGKRIKVSKVNNLKGALLATGFAYNVRWAKNNNINNFINVIKVSQAVRRAGSAALDLCYVACGRFDGFWELCLNPWDTAAGFIIVEEAGGKVTKLDGKKYSIYDTEILATNSRIHPQIRRIIQ